jgi:hypothetical protein
MNVGVKIVSDRNVKKRLKELEFLVSQLLPSLFLKFLLAEYLQLDLLSLDLHPVL